LELYKLRMRRKQWIKYNLNFENYIQNPYTNTYTVQTLHN